MSKATKTAIKREALRAFGKRPLLSVGEAPLGECWLCIVNAGSLSLEVTALTKQGAMEEMLDQLRALERRAT